MPDIHLAAEDARFVEEQVKAGIYQSADEVVAAALRLLGREGKLQALRSFIQEGMDDLEAGRVVSFESEDELTAFIMAMGEQGHEAKAPGDDGKGIARSSRSI